MHSFLLCGSMVEKFAPFPRRFSLLLAAICSTTSRSGVETHFPLLVSFLHTLYMEDRHCAIDTPEILPSLDSERMNNTYRVLYVSPFLDKNAHPSSYLNEVVHSRSYIVIDTYSIATVSGAICKVTLSGGNLIAVVPLPSQVYADPGNRVHLQTI